MFHWDIDQILNMRASAFFSVLNKSREIYWKNHAIKMRDLCDVQVCSMHIDNYKNTWERFNQRAIGVEVRKSKPIQYDDDRAAENIERMFNTYGHLMG